MLLLHPREPRGNRYATLLELGRAPVERDAKGLHVGNEQCGAEPTGTSKPVKGANVNEKRRSVRKKRRVFTARISFKLEIQLMTISDAGMP